ncbi:MAG: hypothetical protein V8S08_13560 [Lachnoclostridium sp.]
MRAVLVTPHFIVQNYTADRLDLKYPDANAAGCENSLRSMLFGFDLYEAAVNQ